jgi:hypothetical protein
MDLRSRISSRSQLERFKSIVASTDFMYQPFIISDDIEVGGGYEFIFNRIGAGFVYWRDDTLPPNAPVRSHLIDPDNASDFRIANAALRQVYDQCVEAICRQAGDIQAKTFADFGCFNGYMPVALSQRGARRAVGYDIDDRGECIAALNSILGTRAEFIHSGYDLATGIVPKAEQFDIVCCMSLLQHIPEPMRFINLLSAMTRECLFLMTNVWTDDDLVMRFGQPNAIRAGDAFPWCFDNGMYLSEKLLRTAFRLAGFHTLIEVPVSIDPAVQRRVEEVNRGLNIANLETSEERGLARGTLKGLNLLALRDGPSVGIDELPHVHELGYRRSLFRPRRWSLFSRRRV